MKRRALSLLAAAGGLLALAWILVNRGVVSQPRTPKGHLTSEAAEEIARDYLSLEAREQAIDQTLWSPERDAERHEDELIRLWDALNLGRKRWDILCEFPVSSVTLPVVAFVKILPQGIRQFSNGPGTVRIFHSGEWPGWLRIWESEGWTLEGSHWALISHRPESAGKPALSMVRLSARLENATRGERASLRAHVELLWQPGAGASPVLDQATVRDVEILSRSGPPPFRLWMEADLPADPGTFNDPLLVRDFNGDGRPEILLAGGNWVWVNATASHDVPAPFLRQRAGALPSERIQAAIVADLDGDQREDLLLGGKEGVRWMSRGSGITFDSVHSGWRAPHPLRHPQAVTAGDVDGDGDLDLWFVQYKLPYQQGQFPTPWFDARDGFPSHLLLNDGHGVFTDATDASGLDSVRNRRSYSASWIDLDGDGDLDLVNVSDFAGLDILLNDGLGHFQDVSDSLGEARHGFGMAHAIRDFNGDGRPDLLMLGMGSTVAERLLRFGIDRRTVGETPATLAAMTQGNRLYLGSGVSGVPLTPATGRVAESLAATGWTWGAAWEDFDNDGTLDLAVANGHETRASTADYERQFWLHDRFVGSSTNNSAVALYFRTAAGRRQAAHASYGGWQDNEFRLHVGDGEFPDVAWVLGLALPVDCRNLVAADLDLDGRMDLVMTTQEEWPQRRQRLLVYRNELDAGNWMGFRFPGAPQPGTRVELQLGGHTVTRWLVTGDGFRSQGPAAAHFGLGTETPGAVRVHWPGGGVTEISTPAINQWHLVPPPSAPTR